MTWHTIDGHLTHALKIWTGRARDYMTKIRMLFGFGVQRRDDGLGHDFCHQTRSKIREVGVVGKMLKVLWYRAICIDDGYFQIKP